MSRTFRLSSSLLIVSLGAAGCVDPQKTFGEFGERVTDAAPLIDSGGGGVFDISGEFLLSVQTQLDAPLRLIVTASFTPEGDGGSVDFAFVPLAAEMCAPGMGGQPVGEPLTLDDVPVSATGSINAALDMASVPPDANPISCTEIRADLELIGSIKSTDLVCGDIAGMLYAPAMLELTGTFGAVRIEPGTVGDANLPTPVIECPAEDGDDAGPIDAGEADAGDPDASELDAAVDAA